MTSDISAVLDALGITGNNRIVEKLGIGLINNTWHVKHDQEEYILQKINHQIFKNPADISKNIRHIRNYLTRHHPDYLFVAPIPVNGGDDLLYIHDGYFRLFPFVKNSRTYTSADDSDLTYEAARQFGRFTHLLAGFDPSLLKITIPDFHHITLRYQQYELALQKGDNNRIREAAGELKLVERYHSIVSDFEKYKKKGLFRTRVAHHDTKISNVLFDQNNKGLCVIDLDTVMPGLFISDVGDMMRTYLSAANEEEKDFTKIDVREEHFSAIVEGYLSEMGDELTRNEQEHFIYAGKFMIYMQAIRFLTDHLNNDIYYEAKYEGHNLVRAGNQLSLLNRLEEKQSVLMKKIRSRRFYIP